MLLAANERRPKVVLLPARAARVGGCAHRSAINGSVTEGAASRGELDRLTANECRATLRRSKEEEEEEEERMDESQGVGLADALEQLRSDLASAREKAAGTPVQFPIETLTVELKVGITKSRDGKAAFTVPFVGVELGGSAGRSSETLQTVTLVLGPPVDQEGNPIKVASASEARKD